MRVFIFNRNESGFILKSYEEMQADLYSSKS